MATVALTTSSVKGPILSVEFSTPYSTAPVFIRTIALDEEHVLPLSGGLCLFWDAAPGIVFSEEMKPSSASPTPKYVIRQIKVNAIRRLTSSN